MVEFNDPTQANMDIVLEEICAELPHGAGMRAASSSPSNSFNALGVAMRSERPNNLG